MYIRISEGLTKYKLIPDSESPWSHISSTEKDHYIGIYKYNEEHYKMYQATGSVAGIKDSVTNSLVFDFDDATNIENARKDAVTVVSRLLSNGVPPDAIQITFSGNKGFGVQVDTDQTFTPEEFKRATFALAEDLKTFDKVVNDSQRLIRMVGTKNPKSGLYKIPLTIDKLSDAPIEQIKGEASALSNFDDELFHSWVPTKLPEAIKNMTIKKEEKKEVKAEVHDLNLTLKPKWLSDAKFALQNGYFGAGERNLAFMILASTYKNQSFPKEIVYRMLKGVAEIQAERNGVERYSDKELYNNIVEVVFNPSWKGGTYSYENTPLLQEVTARLGLKPPTANPDETYEPKQIHSIHGRFKDYVLNIDKNTIKTGIETLDKNVFISTGCNMAIVGAPGSGKTSITLNILNNTSKAGIKSVFASFDMARTRMYEKILYRLTSLPRETLYKKITEEPEWEEKMYQKVKEEFGNVYFFDKSAATVDDIRNYIIKCNEKAERPEDRIKLIMVDYFERVHTDVGDDTAASKKVANQLQDLVAEFDLAQIVLLQPNKMSGDLSEPIKSYMSIKGSSFLQQSFRVILGIYREGYDPMYPEDDRFITANLLKNDLGETCSMDFSWEGKTGIISEISDEEREELKALRKVIAENKKDSL